jgi:hypothetical protein
MIRPKTKDTVNNRVFSCYVKNHFESGRDHMYNSYKNERSRKRLVVPVIVLMLCAAALVGLGYAALTSTVTNQANVVAGDGLDAELRGTDGNLLAGTQFSAGADTIDFGTEQTDAGAKTYYVLAMDDMKLGGATLFLRTIDSGVTAVDISYEVTFYEEGVEVTDGTPYGMTISHMLKITSPDSGVLASNDGMAVNGTGIAYAVELLADIAAADGLPVEPSGLSYDITITVTPVTV